MSILDDKLNQVAVYWPPASTDGTGSPVSGTPIAIPCRWSDKAIQMMDEEGQEFVSRSVVYVSQILVRKGYLMKGAAGLTQKQALAAAPADPTSSPSCALIEKFFEWESVSANDVVYKAIL